MFRFIFLVIFILFLYSCSNQKQIEFNGIKLEKWNETLMDNYLLEFDSIVETNESSSTKHLEVYDTLLLIAKKNKLKNAEQNLYRRYAFLYSELGSLNQATEYLNKSILISQQLNDTFAYWSTKANLGLIYFRFKIYEKAIQTILPSVQYFKTKKQIYSYSHWMYNLSEVYKENNQLIQAIECAKEAFIYKKKVSEEYQFLKNDSLLFALNWVNLLNKVNNDSALHLLNQFEPWMIKEKDSILKSYAFGLSSIIYQSKNKIKSSAYFDSCNFYFSSNSSQNDKLSQYQILSDYYFKNGRSDSALKYNLLKQSLNDSFYSIDKLKIMSNSERMYSLIVNKDIQLLNKEKQNQKAIVIFLILFIFVLLILFYLAYNNYKKNKERILTERNIKINKLIEEVNQSKMEAWAEGQEKERTRIAAELHDRLGGLLVMAGQHFNQFEKKFEQLKKENQESFSEFKKIINSAIIEVRELSKDISSNLVSKLGLSNALLDLKNKVESATGIEIDLKVYNAESRINLSSEIAFFRVVQESLNNIIKHANANKISISLTGNEDSLVMMIEDNGKGFHLNDLNSVTGLGIKSMQKRILDIGGIFNIDSKVGRGTIVIVELNIIKE